MRCAPSPRAVTLAALLLALSGPAQAQRVSGAKVEAAVRTAIARYLERSHLRPDLVDADALVAEARRRSEETGSILWLDDWLGSELHRATWAFAPADARPDPTARYGLPFDPVFPRFLTQGPGGAWSHTGPNHYSFDFVMPVGTALLAAREGVVALVVDGFTEGSTDPDLKRRANAVYVLHADGTVAQYVHVAPGIPVKENERVSRGQVIATSGLTGWTAVPHLCFAVLRKGPDGLETIPIRFGLPGPHPLRDGPSALC